MSRIKLTIIINILILSIVSFSCQKESTDVNYTLIVENPTSDNIRMSIDGIGPNIINSGNTKTFLEIFNKSEASSVSIISGVINPQSGVYSEIDNFNFTPVDGETYTFIVGSNGVY